MKPQSKAVGKKSNDLEIKSSRSYQIADQIHQEKLTLESNILATTDDFGNSPLHYLALYGWLGQVSCKTVPVSAWLRKNKGKFTPAHYVRRSQFHCLPQSRQIEKAMESRGAEYWASQAHETLGSEKSEIRHIELF